MEQKTSFDSETIRIDSDHNKLTILNIAEDKIRLRYYQDEKAHFYTADFEAQSDASSGLEKTLSDLPVDLMEVSKLKIGMLYPFFSLIPEVFFQKDDVRTLAGANLHIPAGSLVMEDKLKFTDARLLYVLRFDKYRLLHQLNKNTDIEHLAVSLLNLFYEQSRGKQKATFLYKLNKHLLVAVFIDQKMVFANIFSVMNADDMLYYTLLVLESTGLDQENDPVYLSGEIKEGGVLYNHLHKYIRKLHFSELETKDFKKIDSIDVDIYSHYL
ncbi:MAG: DUF3822 family protein [Chitinophagaceae bacterium]|nr:MAG: DUF3822 family protein [Chitinophagaceae bacterium]